MSILDSGVSRLLGGYEQQSMWIMNPATNIEHKKAGSWPALQALREAPPVI